MADQTPSIVASMAITPSPFPTSGESKPNITLTVTSHHSEPITILTYTTIFNLEASLFRSNFTCRDISNPDDPKPMHIDYTHGPRRPGFNRESGGPDDQYFVTLEPMVPVTFTSLFWLQVTPWPEEEDEDGEEVEDIRIPAFLPGHTYQLGAKDNVVIRDWWVGRKDQIMSPPGQKANTKKSSGSPIAPAIEDLIFHTV